MARIAICIPGCSFNYVVVAHLLQLQAYLLGEGHTVAIAPGYTNNLYITRQVIWNNLLTDKELDYILFLDDDNVVTTEAFSQLFDDLEAHPEVDAVTAWYWCAGHVFEGVRPSVGTFTDEQMLANLSEEQLTGKALVPVEWAGLGCVLMRARCLEISGKKPFIPILRDCDLGFDGDDISFFHKFQDGGGVMMCDPKVHVPHLKVRSVSPPLRKIPQDSPKELPEEVAA